MTDRFDAASIGVTHPTVSAIIPTFNRAHIVGKAIDSALAQTLEDFEVIVVDDGSTDSTEEFVRSLPDPRIRYLRHSTNRGPSAARNTGILAARGEFLAFLDDDDVWLPLRLERQVQAFHTTNLERVGVVVCGYQSRLGDSIWTKIPHHRGWLYETLISGGGTPWGSPTLMVRRAVSDPPILFDESLPAAEDWDYMIRLSKLCQVEVAPEILTQTNRYPGAYASMASRIIEGREALLRKHAKALETRPKALVRHHVRLAELNLSLGQRQEARRHLKSALRAMPNGRNLLGLAGSYLGSFGLRASMRLLRERNR